MTQRPPPSKKQAPETFEISVDSELLTAAIAAVEKRMGGSQGSDSALEAELSEDIEVQIEAPVDGAIDANSDDDVYLLSEDQEPSSSDEDMEAFLAGGQAPPQPTDDGDDDFGDDPEESAWVRQQLQSTMKELEKHKARSQKLERRLRKTINEQRKSEASLKRLENSKDRALRAAEDAYEAREAAERQAEHSSSLVQHLQKETQSLKTARKRDKTQRDMSESGGTIEALLPILDNLEMATSHLDADPTQVIAGIRMIVEQFQNTLERLGVERIESSPGIPFSPKLHEAMSHIATDKFPSGTITEEILAGYSFQGRLLRASRVVVAAAIEDAHEVTGEE